MGLVPVYVYWVTHMEIAAGDDDCVLAPAHRGAVPFDRAPLGQA
jgi:hypothetical protein